MNICFNNDVHFPELVSLGAEGFSFYHRLAGEMLEFYFDTNTYPDVDSFKAWSNDAETKMQLSDIVAHKVDPKKAGVYVKVLRSTMVGRGLIDLSEHIADKAGNEPHNQLLAEVAKKLDTVRAIESDKMARSRGFYWEQAPDRWKRFKRVRKNPFMGIPFYIKDVDKVTKGLHTLKGEADMVAIYGKPGSYKTRLMVNMAISQAKHGHSVVFISRESSAERIAFLLDSILSLVPDSQGNEIRLSYENIIEANLNPRFSKRYGQLLREIYDSKFPLWFVDCPGSTTTLDILQEVEIFKTETGAYPKVIFVDYANLIEPIGEYSGEHQKLDRVFIELLAMCKGYEIPLVTPIRESRTGSLIKERGEVGLEHVGLSQSIAYHVHQLWHIDQTKDEKDQNLVGLRAKKNRYGALFDVLLNVLPEYGYVGDPEFSDDFSGLDDD